jgi:hypothetical protein
LTKSWLPAYVRSRGEVRSEVGYVKEKTALADVTLADAVRGETREATNPARGR